MYNTIVKQYVQSMDFYDTVNSVSVKELFDGSFLIAAPTAANRWDHDFINEIDADKDKNAKHTCTRFNR